MDKSKLFEQGLRLARDGDLAGARELLERAHELDPDDRNIEVTLEVFRRRSEERGEPALASHVETNVPQPASGTEALDSLHDRAPTTDKQDRKEPRSYFRHEAETRDAVSVTDDSDRADNADDHADADHADSEVDTEQQAEKEERPSLRARTGATLARIISQPKRALTRLRPAKRTPKPRIVVERDVPYHLDGKREHRLDIYRAEVRKSEAPAILYLEAVGFKHGLSAIRHPVTAFARRGWLAVHVRYRSIPHYPFPASLLDCARAYQWFIERASSLGSSPHRVVVAGDTTGANLALALALASCDLRDEVWAQRLFDLGIPPRALLLCSSYLQASDPDRFDRLDPNIDKRAIRPLRDFQARYLEFDPRLPDSTRQLADPLVLLESDHTLSRPLPPCFAAVGTDDVFLDDTRRLEVAYQERQDICSARYVEGPLASKLASAWRHADVPWVDAAFEFLELHT